MRVAVENLTGRFFYVEVEEGATVGDLKKEIAKAESAEEEKLVLVPSDGRPVMKDDLSSLEGHGISEGSLVYLFFSSSSESTYWPKHFGDYMTFQVKDSAVKEEVVPKSEKSSSSSSSSSSS